MSRQSGSSPSGLGQLGERLAARYLESLGYVVLDRNFRWRYGEIDLVARRGNRLAFVEVRTRRGDAYGDPVETLTAKKQERLRATAEHYCQTRPAEETDWQIDLVAVRFDERGRLLGIELVENAVGG